MDEVRLTHTHAHSSQHGAKLQKGGDPVKDRDMWIQWTFKFSHAGKINTRICEFTQSQLTARCKIANCKRETIPGYVNSVTVKFSHAGCKFTARHIDQRPGYVNSQFFASTGSCWQCGERWWLSEFTTHGALCKDPDMWIHKFFTSTYTYQYHR